MTIHRAQQIYEKVKNQAKQREFIRRDQIDDKITYTRSYVLGRKKRQRDDDS